MTQSRTRISKAVIPAAGLGTRFLPATKATPKEMLPVVDKPAIQYVVEEAVAAGLSDVLMVTGRNKRPLEDHFDRNYELEEALSRKGDDARLARVQESSDLATMHYVRQGDPRGLGHAVLCAAPHVGDQPFAVLLGDDLIDAARPAAGPHDRGPGAVRRQRRRADGGRPEQIHLYGCAAVEPTGGRRTSSGSPTWSRSRTPAEAPSNYAVIGRYVLDPAVFDVLRKTAPGRGGEIQLTDALAGARRGPRRSAARCTAWSSAAAATTPATAATTCMPLSDSRANVRTWARTSGPGCAVTSPRRCST